MMQVICDRLLHELSGERCRLVEGHEGECNSLPPRRSRKVVPPVNPDLAIAETIARAVFPLAWSDSPVIQKEVALGVPIERHRVFQIERCLPAVKALRERGLIP